jgi:hypothetical protein
VTPKSCLKVRQKIKIKIVAIDLLNMLDSSSSLVIFLERFLDKLRHRETCGKVDKTWGTAGGPPYDFFS